MEVRVRFQGGPRDGEQVTFGESVRDIVLGRDPKRCQVVFAADLTMIGREHCALQRSVGSYRLLMPPRHLVLVDDERALDGDVLDQQSCVQIGRDGPKLMVDIVDDSSLAPAELHHVEPLDRRRLLRRVNRASKRAKLLSMCALVLVAALGLLLVRELTRPADDSTGSAERMVGAIRASQGQLAALQRAQLEQKRQLERIARSRGPVLQETLQTLAQSVYLVMVEGKGGGGQRAGGTAWVVGDGTLVTNAHVAELFHDPDVQAMLVRSSSSPPRDVRVERVSIHPGYSGFPALIQRFAPRIRSAYGDLGAVSDTLRGLGFCDVALLHVDDAAELGPELRLASPESLLGLRPAQMVGSVGYPAEGMAFFNAQRPVPQVQLGHVTSMTSFLFGRTDAASALLVQHSVPGTGGSSGSPIFDEAGSVVAIANMVNFAHVQQGGVETVTQSSGQASESALVRLPIAVGVNYAQRADLASHLVDGTANDQLRNLEARWLEELDDYGSGRLPPGQEIQRVARVFERDNDSESLVAIADWSGEIKTDAARLAATHSMTVRCDSAGTYLVAAAADAAASILLQVDTADGERLQSGAETTWSAAVEVPVEQPMELQIKLTVRAPGAGCTLQVFRAEPVEPRKRRWHLIRAWAQEPSVFPRVPLAVMQTSGELQAGREGADCRRTIQVEVPGATPHFMIAMAPQRRDINLSIVSSDGWGTANTRPDWHPTVAGETPEDADFDVTISGREPGTAFQFWLYRAVDLSPEQTRDAVLREWSPPDAHIQLLAGKRGRLGPAASDGLATAGFDVPTQTGGRYLVLAIPDTATDLDLVIAQAGGGVLATEESRCRFSAAELTTDAATDLRVTVTGRPGHQALGFVLYVLRAVAAAP